MTDRCLVLVRAGDQSLHPSWFENGGPVAWDFAISCFGKPPRAAERAIFVHMQKGPKWIGLAATLREHEELIRSYDYVWLPDDDITCSADTVNRMFATVRRYGMELAQPALDPSSYFSHTITLRHEGFELRFTNFVELMVPIFSRGMLERARPTMEDSLSGWGLDLLWSQLGQLGQVGILDCAAVRHTRPVGGPNYQHVSQGGTSTGAEFAEAMARLSMDRIPDDAINFGGVAVDGGFVGISDRYFEMEAFLRALNAGIERLEIDMVKRTRYLAHHWNFAVRQPRSFPRHMVHDHLRQRLPK